MNRTDVRALIIVVAFVAIVLVLQLTPIGNWR